MIRKTQNIVEAFKNYKNLRLKGFYIFLKMYNITSNQITFLSLFFGLTSVFFLGVNNIIFIILFLISVIFDIIDGGLAIVEKKSLKAQKFGMLLDDFSDRTVFSLIILKLSFLSSSLVFLTISVLYIILKSYHIFLKQRLSKNIKILYVDRISVLLIFINLKLMFFLIFIVLFINLFELLNIIKRNKIFLRKI